MFVGLYVGLNGVDLRWMGFKVDALAMERKRMGSYTKS